MKNKTMTLLLAAVLLGCGKREPRDIIIMPDVSASIDRESLNQAFKAIDGLASSLQRGDKLTIIPILGDAQAEASGRILRFDVPMNRQAYDSDLKEFRHKLETSLERLQKDAAAHPGSKTDILGSFALAGQEFQTAPHTARRELIVLSDFIQEDGRLDFLHDRQLNAPLDGKQFSEQLAKQAPIQLANVFVYLGVLRSREYSRLDPKRRAALQSFWMNYSQLSGGTPRFISDGAGLLGRYEAPGE